MDRRDDERGVRKVQDGETVVAKVDGGGEGGGGRRGDEIRSDRGGSGKIEETVGGVAGRIDGDGAEGD